MIMMIMTSMKITTIIKMMITMTKMKTTTATTMKTMTPMMMIGVSVTGHRG